MVCLPFLKKASNDSLIVSEGIYNCIFQNWFHYNQQGATDVGRGSFGPSMYVLSLLPVPNVPSPLNIGIANRASVLLEAGPTRERMYVPPPKQCATVKIQHVFLLYRDSAFASLGMRHTRVPSTVMKSGGGPVLAFASFVARQRFGRDQSRGAHERPSLLVSISSATE